MLNDPETPQKPPRRPHPLEQRPPERDPANEERRRIILHIPVTPPTITYALIALNTVIFVVGFFVISPDQLNALYDWGATNRESVLVMGEYHRLLTAMFLHGGLAHIAFNMYALYAIGQTVERFFGHFRFALVYFLGGLAGSVLSVLLNGPQVFSVGASGAVFAIVGGEMAFLYKHRKLLGDMGRAQLRQLIIIAGINFAFGFATTVDSGGVNIDNWGHIGGLIGGLIVAWIISPLFLIQRHPENPQALMTYDSNPLQRQTQPLLAYFSGLLAILIAASILAR
ncbi:MAG: rhomboid family intramembrane serine protease [Anaerolineae bacterium]